MTETRKLRVFLCHSSQDKPTVRELYQRLLAEGWIDPWLDEERLLPGQEWDIEIEKAVETTDAVIVCLSGNSVTKDGYIQKEMRLVLGIAEEKPEETIFVVPLRLDECIMPRRLRVWQYVDYFPKEKEVWAYGKVLGSLKIRANALGIDLQELEKQFEFTKGVGIPRGNLPPINKDLFSQNDILWSTHSKMKYIVEILEIENIVISDFQKKTIRLNEASDAKMLLSELKIMIDNALETREINKLSFYYFFLSQCYMFLDKKIEAVNSATFSIDYFRAGGMAWLQAMGHWFLGLIYCSAGNQRQYLGELNRAISIVEPMTGDYLINGNYAAAKNAEEIKNKLISERDALMNAE